MSAEQVEFIVGVVKWLLITHKEDLIEYFENKKISEIDTYSL